MSDVDDVLDVLARMADAARRLDEARPRVVEAARAAGATWGQIGTALGTSRQAAQMRYGKTEAGGTAAGE